MEDDGWITLHNLKILQRKSQIILKDKDEIVQEQEDSNINHTCDFCEKSFINKIILKRHIKGVHENVLCRFCNKSFGYNWLSNHIKIVHEKIKAWKCNFCEKTCSKSGHLKTHIRSVHGNKEKNKAKCVICEEEFPQEYIKEHMKRVHEGEKVCGICKKHFRNSKMLSEHRKNAHENLAGYECFYCPKYFNTKIYLKKHVKRVHAATLNMFYKEQSIKNAFVN